MNRERERCCVVGIEAKYMSICGVCLRLIHKGDRILWEKRRDQDDYETHEKCPVKGELFLTPEEERLVARGYRKSVIISVVARLKVTFPIAVELYREFVQRRAYERSHAKVAKG